jgi:hypothetical protein
MENFVVDIRNGAGLVVRSKPFAIMEYAADYCKRYNADGAIDFVASVRGQELASPFHRVAAMNEAFSKPRGDAKNTNWEKVRNQCKNIFDGYCELLAALGVHDADVAMLSERHSRLTGNLDLGPQPDTTAVRDALCDIQVFAQGAQHMMGYNGDNDMHDVIDGVMTRFIKDDDDEVDTKALHKGRGVTEVYFEGEYPTRVMKSAVDQPDAPKGKVLKSASFKNTIFREAQ